MQRWCIIVGIITHILITGCEEVVYTTAQGGSATSADALLDSAQYHLDVSEQPINVLRFLAKVLPLKGKPPEIQQRYTGILVAVAWQTCNYEDVLTIAAPSVYQLTIKGGTYSGDDTYLANMAAHALRKSGDTVSAVKLYELLASSEFLSFRRGAQANLLTLYSKLHQYQRAVDLATSLEGSELMNPNDISAHINREYYWGRSLYHIGNTAEGTRHLKRLDTYLRASRPNNDPTELRVRLSTVRGIIADLQQGDLPSRIKSQLIPALQSSMLTDSATLFNSFQRSESPATFQGVRIPDSLFVGGMKIPPLTPVTAVDNVVITSHVTDTRGAHWYSTLCGLYIRVGEYVVRVPVPEHHGLHRPVRSVAILQDSLIIQSYTGKSYAMPIQRLVANFSPLRADNTFYSVQSASVPMTEKFQRTSLAVNDTTMLVASGSRLQLRQQHASHEQTIDIPGVIAPRDTVIAMFRTGDSIVVCSRTLGMKVFQRSLLARGICEYARYDALKALRRMNLRSAASEILTKHIMSEHPKSDSPVHDGLGPSTIQRMLFCGRDTLVFIRSRNIVVSSVKNGELRMYEWPDSLIHSIELGFHTQLNTNNSLTITTDRYEIHVDLGKLLSQPIPQYLLACFSQSRELEWVGWTSRVGPTSINCGDSLSFIVGSSYLITGYLASITAQPAWSSSSISNASKGWHALDVPSTRTCSLRLSAPGAIDEAVVILKPQLHPMMYQDAWILLTMIVSGVGAWGVVYTWQRIARRNRERRELQHLAIARDLHDTLGADLARLTALLNASDTGQSRDIANAALAANRKFRSLLWIWRSDSIKLTDFAGELREYVHECLADAQITGSARLPEISEDVYIDATTAKNILIILNESITNVIRHSQATKTALSFTLKDGMCTISFSDNGIGFDAATLERASGVRNIPDRATQHGFIAQVVSQPHVGTTVLISFGVH